MNLGRARAGEIMTTIYWMSNIFQKNSVSKIYMQKKKIYGIYFTSINTVLYVLDISGQWK